MEDTAWHKAIEEVRQSEEYGKYMERIGWKVEKVSITNYQLQIFIKKLGGVSIAKIQRVDLPLPWIEVEKVLKEHKVFMCKLEPLSGEEVQPGFKRDNWPLLGTKTLRVNLHPSEEKITASFKKDCRYELRRVQGLGYKVQMNDFDKFYKIWRRANKVKDLWTPPEKDFWGLVESFGEKCFCITISDLGGCLVLLHEKVAYYHYSGTLPEGKKQGVPYAVVWEGMKEAKKRGARMWDFDGIYDSRWPNKGWKGFTHFKKSFGGVEVEFGGCFTKWRWPF